ncbi:MAG: hypothetical protein V4645_08285 [Pseudomonadota bacterium]
MIDALVSEIYAAASGRAHWSSTLAHVARYLDLWTIQIMGVDKRQGHLMFSVHGGRSTPQTALDYFRQYNALDPRVGMALATPPGQWLHCHEHFDDRYVAHDPFYQDFLIPHGGRYASGTVLIDNDEVVFLLAMMRGHGSHPLHSGEMKVFEQFRFHFAEAMHNLVHVREAYAELGMARELLNQFGYPMLLVDETRGIRHRNSAAAKLLREGRVVAERGGFLAGLGKGENEALTEAIYALQLSETEAPPSLRRGVVPLKGASGEPWLAFVSAVRPDQAMGAFGLGARALVILHGPAQRAQGLDPFILAECFKLTPAESRVAAQLAGGSNIKEIAQRSGKALATVRTQVAQVMLKADVNRQSDLVRVLLSLPARTFAHGSP